MDSLGAGIGGEGLTSLAAFRAAALSQRAYYVAYLVYARPGGDCADLHPANFGDEFDAGYASAVPPPLSRADIGRLLSALAIACAQHGVVVPRDDDDVAARKQCKGSECLVCIGVLFLPIFVPLYTNGGHSYPFIIVAVLGCIAFCAAGFRVDGIARKRGAARNRSAVGPLNGVLDAWLAESGHADVRARVFAVNVSDRGATDENACQLVIVILGADNDPGTAQLRLPSGTAGAPSVGAALVVQRAAAVSLQMTANPLAVARRSRDAAGAPGPPRPPPAGPPGHAAVDNDEDPQAGEDGDWPE